MRRSNLATLSFFIILILATVFFMVFRKDFSGSPGEDISGGSGITGEIEAEASAPDTVGEIDGSDEADSSDEADDSAEAGGSKEVEGFDKPVVPKEQTAVLAEGTPVQRGNALFIGDSRTVGLWEYGSMEGVDFFASEGMSVYNIHKKPLSVPGVGKITLTELLENKQYAKIYIMLGINELGYDLNKTAAKYKELTAFIKGKQPAALLFLQANLHVSKKRSDRDPVINNGKINEINTKIAELADNKEIYYLDANILFDDGSGSLAAEKTEDEAHPYGKYYAGWSDWIIQQTALLAGEG